MGTAATYAARSDSSVLEAYRWALRARSTAEVGSPGYIYALNLFVYYASEGPDEDEFTKAEPYAIELLGFRENQMQWQYRYSDTLARFYHRLAFRRQGAARLELLVQALQMSDEAAREGRADRTVTTYFRQLKLIVERRAQAQDTLADAGLENSKGDQIEEH
jgi:hypothetical protein